MNQKSGTNVSGAMILFSLVLGLSLFLLIFVGQGDARRVYPDLYLNKIKALGDIVREAVDSFLISGHPLEYYTGFPSKSANVLKAEESIQGIEITDLADRTIFPAPGDEIRKFKTLAYEISGFDTSGGEVRVYENRDYFKVSFPLKNKFEEVGVLNLYTGRVVPGERINRAFFPVYIAFLVFVLVAAPLGFIFVRRGGGMRGIFFIAFLSLAALILAVLINLYTRGIEDKTGAFAGSLGQRLNSALSLGLKIEDFTGVEELFGEYREINGDIASISLSRGDSVLIHPDPGALGKPYAPGPGLRAYSFSLPGELILRLEIPRNLLYLRLLRSGKNFLVLLVASTFLSMLFLNLLIHSRGEARKEEVFRLELIRPLYFMAMFLEGLFISFLPQFFQEATAKAGLPGNYDSYLFTLYFAAFLLSLIPSGRFADRHSPKPLLAVGAALFSLGYLVLFFFDTISMIVVSRVFSGLGQGMLFIGVQSFILKTVSRENKTRGTSIIVFGYNGGNISGTAIGALLISYTGREIIFLIAGIVGALLFLYTLFFIPRISPEEGGEGESLFRNLGKVFRDFEFMKTMLFVGIITKGVLTGVFKFALPKMLGRMNYLKEDIGQILIFYSLGVLLSTFFVARRKDRPGVSTKFLFFGTQLGGFALYGLGFMDWDLQALTGIPYAGTIFLVSGLLLLGIAHGFIHSPIVTHISETPVALSSGVGSVTSLYRFMERLGHVSGPVVAGMVMSSLGFSSFSLSWIGMAALGGGLVFLLIRGPGKKRKGEG